MKVKCLINLGIKGEQSRYIILKNAEEREEFEKELAGMLYYEKEFITTKGEIITGSQIILKEVI